MKGSFGNTWKEVDKLNIDQTANLILTSKSAKESVFETWILDFLCGEEIEKFKVLDFGCGFGRNTFGIANHNPDWSVVGYDNPNMLSKTEEYKNLHYQRGFFNVEFNSDWENLKERKFDVIVAILVLQHIFETPLKQYIEDFKNMSKRWIINGRRFNDDPKNRSTWKIIEECGCIPVRFYGNSGSETFITDGLPEDHHLAIYEF